MSLAVDSVDALDADRRIAYINAFDEKGNLISSTTVNVNAKGVSE